MIIQIQPFIGIGGQIWSYRYANNVAYIATSLVYSVDI